MPRTSGPFAFGLSTKETGCSPRASLQVCLKVLCLCTPLQCICAHVCKHLAYECMSLCVQTPLLCVFVCGEHGVDGIDHCVPPAVPACAQRPCVRLSVSVNSGVCARPRPSARPGLRCACPRRPGGQRPSGRRPQDALSTTTARPPPPRHPRALPLRAVQHPARLWAERRVRGRSAHSCARSGRNRYIPFITLPRAGEGGRSGELVIKRRKNEAPLGWAQDQRWRRGARELLPPSPPAAHRWPRGCVRTRHHGALSPGGSDGQRRPRGLWAA